MIEKKIQLSRGSISLKYEQPTDGLRVLACVSLEGLKENCHCGSQDCKHEDSPREYNIAVDTIESLVLAMVMEGIDVDSPAMKRALETALEAISNEL